MILLQLNYIITNQCGATAKMVDSQPAGKCLHLWLTFSYQVFSIKVFALVTLIGLLHLC